MVKNLLNYLVVAALIALAWPIGLAGPVKAAVLPGKKPAKPPAQALSLMMMDYPEDQVCTGEKVNFSARVGTGLLASVGVPNAVVSANGGNYKTDKDGVANWTVIATQVGDVKWTVSATKNGYMASNAINFTEKVGDCAWEIGLDYDDFYVDPKSDWTFESSIELPEYVGFKANPDGSLAFDGPLNAQYNGNFYLQTQPFDCFVNPELSGPYSIQASGTFGQGKLVIKLSAFKLTLPRDVTLSCKDKSGEYKIKDQKYTTTTYIDLINEAVPKLTKATFKKQGGVVKFKVGHSVIWPVPSKNGTGVLVVHKVGTTKTQGGQP